MKKIIQKLVEAQGPSGYENKVRELVRGEIETIAKKSNTPLETKVDALGNLTVTRPAPDGPSRKKIMVSAHMDEIGLIVTHVNEDGFVYFTTIGYVYPVNCVGGRIRFLNGAAGVIGTEQIKDRQKIPPIEQMFIDTGVASRKDSAVQVGDIAIFERPFIDLGKRIVAKAMDDRIGVAVLIEVIRQLGNSPHELCFVFSVQEEVGLRGATTAAFGINPDLGLAIDVTSTGDTPKGVKMEVSLGRGPAIKVRDSGILVDPRVVDWMTKAARQAKIPHQIEILESGTTDASAIQLTRAGIPSGCLSIPCRYIHSPSEMVDIQDVEDAVRLLVELLSHPIDL